MFYYSIMVQRILLVVIYLYYTIVFSTFQMGGLAGGAFSICWTRL